MPSTRKSTPSAKSEPKSSTGNAITWMKLPKGVEANAVGPKSPQLDRVLKNGKLNPQARCFGGNHCIV